MNLVTMSIIDSQPGDIWPWPAAIEFRFASRLTFLQCVAGMIVSTLARDFITDEEKDLELRLAAPEMQTSLTLVTASCAGWVTPTETERGAAHWRVSANFCVRVWGWKSSSANCDASLTLNRSKEIKRTWLLKKSAAEVFKYYGTFTRTFLSMFLGLAIRCSSPNAETLWFTSWRLPKTLRRPEKR